MPVALVPPENVKPFESQYIERSTTMGTLLVTSTTAPNECSIHIERPAPESIRR